MCPVFVEKLTKDILSDLNRFWNDKNRYYAQMFSFRYLAGSSRLAWEAYTTKEETNESQTMCFNYNVHSILQLGIWQKQIIKLNNSSFYQRCYKQVPENYKNTIVHTYVQGKCR